MPVFLLPVLNGISNVLKVPAIAAFLSSLATQVLGFFVNLKFARAVAINLTVITMVVGLTIASMTAVYAVGSGLSYVTPPFVAQAWGMFVPDNAVGCVSAIFSARIIRWVWSWQFYVITKVSS
ncbi:DUF5455 family protein [Vibrio fluvialis]|uniref:DUF5455 family protein n=1 Tax=Vibrio fluvialis TaxID=676 RepID=UPI001C9DF37C|nr:DUF5455 family protein [Vibrio fluvialis]EKO3494134.1 DUF5455 family protein [Vibrio fluvialis]MBY7969333.1 DUF5455 family protein [Vibrio fluvialis]MCE7595387.1 DUF5455 family protein [Vibrio fluvialis]MCE7641824.1 DUF5455 family protein [Vibrio fluvialis]